MDQNQKSVVGGLAGGLGGLMMMFGVVWGGLGCFWVFLGVFGCFWVFLAAYGSKSTLRKLEMCPKWSTSTKNRWMGSVAGLEGGLAGS